MLASIAREAIITVACHDFRNIGTQLLKRKIGVLMTSPRLWLLTPLCLL